jgi:cytochrome c
LNDEPACQPANTNGVAVAARVTDFRMVLPAFGRLVLHAGASTRRGLGGAVCTAPFVLCVAAASAYAQTDNYPGIGRAATPKELAAWDIDVRPDFKGLPPGSGSVATGQQVWDAQCASCHGVFGESNQVFHPLVGGTTAADVQSGRVARLTDRAYPARTTLMKAATISTLWDYINRAMPWTKPKSLSTAEVYAVTAYLLNLGGIVPDDFVLSDRNIAEVQARMPNRDGMTREHALWPGGDGARRAPDVTAHACMRDCGTMPQVASSIPDFARDAHGNLAEQNRPVGAQRGADTRKASSSTSAAAPAKASAIVLTQNHACVACHGLEDQRVGPSFRDIAKKYAGRTDATNHLTDKIRAGGSGVWGPLPMPPQSLDEADARAIAHWLSDGAQR